MKKRLLSVIMAVAMLEGNWMQVNAEEVNLLQEAVYSLEEGYAEYYNILNKEVTFCSSSEVNGNIENLYFLEMTVSLKADTVEEMDYYQGVAAYYNTAMASGKQSKSISDYVHREYLSLERRDIYEELESYIDKEQSLVFYFKEIYPVNDETDKKILFENGMDYVSWEEILPLSSSQIRAKGYSAMASIDSQFVPGENNMQLQAQKASYSYSVSDAVAYMTRYTSNAVSCNVCGSGCSSKVDTTKYNPNYAYYVYVGNHVDCANYVSQALCEGGIPTDNTWKPNSSSWYNVSNLTTYMTSNGYWTSVSYNTVQKGDILKFKDGSHVAMITSFDGVTYGYSAHTNDRLNYPITIDSSTAYYYRVG